MIHSERQINKILPCLNDLWGLSLGHESICIAIIDGQVNDDHPALRGANFERLGTLNGELKYKNSASSEHGTHVASIIFGQHHSGVKGIAPICKGLVVPIFYDDSKGGIVPCSQLELARAITQSVDAGAQIINISGGELSGSGEAHPILSNALKYCQEKNVLVVAAAGNDGCACLHIPGALRPVLAVGGMNDHGTPLGFSNWGTVYQSKGILAPGENILGAIGEVELALKSGTSYAAPIVSGIAALLLSIQLDRGEKINPGGIRDALLETAIGCINLDTEWCKRLLKGRINIEGAYSYLTNRKKDIAMNDIHSVLPSSNLEEQSFLQEEETNVKASTEEMGVHSQIEGNKPTVFQNKLAIAPNGIQTSDCGCGGGEAKKFSCGSKATPAKAQIVFALGTLGYAFVSEARRDSMIQHANGANLQDTAQLLSYLDKNPWEAASIVWTLNMDVTPIYAIHPVGPFANEGYARLREFLNDQVKEGAERVSVPGIIGGNVQLMSGQVIPAIIPDLRCMYNWSISKLIETVLGKVPANNAPKEEKAAYTQRQLAIINFLERVYYELRNLGMSPQDRAINYAATNALNAAGIFAEAVKDNMQLDAIETEPSPICRPGAECWDVKLVFFDPEKQFQRARKAYRFTVDVSDVCPVMVGAVKSWFIR